MVQVEMEEAEPIGLLRSLAIQSDYDGRLWRETWYGHHAPCYRLFLFMVISTVTFAFGMLVDFQMMNMPIARILTTAEIQALSQSHKDCFWEICEAARGIDLDCIVNADGASARVDFDSYMGPFQVPMPQKCKKAMEDTVGEQLYQQMKLQGANQSEMQLFAIDNGDSVPPALVTVKPHCAFTFVDHLLQDSQTNQNLGQPNDVPLYSLPEITEGAGQRFQEILPKNVCDIFLPFIEKAHSVLMAGRYVSIVLSVLFLSWIANFMELVWIATGLVLTAFVARWLLPWPDNVIGYERVTMFKVWQAMVLLTFLTREVDTTLGAAGYIALAAILSGAALHYGDRGAAMLWFDLLLLWFGVPYLFPYMDAAAGMIRLFDALNVVGFVTGLVGMFLPGVGWWKLVHLYVFWRAYPLRQRVQRNFLVRVGLADKEEGHLD